MGYNAQCQESTCGLDVAVTCNFPKVDTTGSNPVARFFEEEPPITIGGSFCVLSLLGRV
jgi:hypothetical protein